MTVREILKMGDLRLLRVAQPVTAFDSDALHLLITDMLDTMRAASGAGLAAPQIGVDLQLVIFGSNARNPRKVCVSKPDVCGFAVTTAGACAGCIFAVNQNSLPCPSSLVTPAAPPINWAS